MSCRVQITQGGRRTDARIGAGELWRFSRRAPIGRAEDNSARRGDLLVFLRSADDNVIFKTNRRLRALPVTTLICSSCMHYHTHTHTGPFHTGRGEVCVLLSAQQLTNSSPIRQQNECKRAGAGVCYNTAVTGRAADCEITLAFIYEYLSQRLASEQMSSHGRKNNLSISLSSILGASFFTFRHPLLLQSPFQCLSPLLHFPPTFSL